MKFAFGTILAAVLATGVYAQTPSGSEINQRRENQQDRIAQGVKSGQLTPTETIKLEKQQRRINKTVAAQRRANGGNLTNKEKARDNRSLNRASANIYAKKHNAATAPK
jgi:hypothetical protein